MAARAEDFDKDQKQPSSSSSSSKAKGKGKTVPVAELQMNVQVHYGAVVALLRTRAEELKTIKKRPKITYLNADHFESLKAVAKDLFDLKKAAGEVLTYVFDPDARLTNDQLGQVISVLQAADRFLTVVDGILSSDEAADWMGIVEFLELHLVATGKVPGLCITSAGDAVYSGLTKGTIKKAA